MYRAVIISCLIAVGFAGTVSPYYANRETRQATTASTLTISGFPDHITTTPGTIAMIGNYLLKALGAVFLTTSAVGLVCSYTSICNKLQLAALEQSGGRRRRSYSPNEYNPYLNELTEILMRAMDSYVDTANVKQKREVGQ